MRALVAFDKFKDALSARDACEAAAGALRERNPDAELDLCPLTDGGEGFAATLTRSAAGSLHAFTVRGPLGDPVSAMLGIVRCDAIPPAAKRVLQLEHLTGGSRVAVVEMAAASGLALLNVSDRNPWRTTTWGTGELLLHAGALGVEAIVLGVGGSATNDLGLGALGALGLVGISADGARLRDFAPANWYLIRGFASGADAILPPLRIACDVSNPLLRPHGCTAVFGPQKGLKPDDAPRFEAEMDRISALLCAHAKKPLSLRDAPGMGAAGGITFGLTSLLGAAVIPGFALVSAWLDLERRIASANMIITGEGRFDATSLAGKGPGSIALRAAALGKPVHVFAGQVQTPPVTGVAAHAITPAGMSLAEALPRTAELLSSAVLKESVLKSP